jgi:hypothetical protein
MFAHMHKVVVPTASHMHVPPFKHTGVHTAARVVEQSVPDQAALHLHTGAVTAAVLQPHSPPFLHDGVQISEAAAMHTVPNIRLFQAQLPFMHAGLHIAAFCVVHDDPDDCAGQTHNAVVPAAFQTHTPPWHPPGHEGDIATAHEGPDQAAKQVHAGFEVLQ